MKFISISIVDRLIDRKSIGSHPGLRSSHRRTIPITGSHIDHLLIGIDLIQIDAGNIVFVLFHKIHRTIILTGLVETGILHIRTIIIPEMQETVAFAIVYQRSPADTSTVCNIVISQYLGRRIHPVKFGFIGRSLKQRSVANTNPAVHLTFTSTYFSHIEIRSMIRENITRDTIVQHKSFILHQNSRLFGIIGEAIK